MVNVSKPKPWRKLFRKIVDNPMYFSEPFDKTHAWIDLILIADDDGKIATTVPELADRWKWSEGKVRRFLKAFSDDGSISYNGVRGRFSDRSNGRSCGMFISLENWAFYQGERQLNGRSNGRLNGRSNTDFLGVGGFRNPLVNNNNILREEENTPNISSSQNSKEFCSSDILPPQGATVSPNRRHIPPSIEDVRDYCAKRGKGMDAEDFYDFYEANGWRVGKNPMKDWQAAVRNWERHDDYGKSAKKDPLAGIDWEAVVEEDKRNGLL